MRTSQLVDVAYTPTPEKPQLVQECPAPVYMAKASNGAAAIQKSHAQAAQHSQERTMHAYGLGMIGVPDAPRNQSKAARKPKSRFTPKSSKGVRYLKPWNMQGCIRNEVAKDFAVLVHVKYSVTETYHLRRLYKTSRAALGTTVSPWLKSLGFKESPTDHFLVYHSENDLTMALWGGHIVARGSQDDVSWVFNRLKRHFHCEDGGHINGDKFQVDTDGNHTRHPGGTPRDVAAKVLKYRKQLNRGCDASALSRASSSVAQLLPA